MDEEQDFAYAVSAKALGHIAETAALRLRIATTPEAWRPAVSAIWPRALALTA